MSLFDFNNDYEEEEEKYCEMCNEEIRKDEYYETSIEGGYICEDCIESHYVQCYQCGYYVQKDLANEFYETSDNEKYGIESYICKDCDSIEWIQCDFDGNYEYNDDYEDE